MSISIATTKGSGDTAATAFEREMRALGYRNFEMERGRYCLQELNEMKKAYLAGCRNACEAA